jgi:hypothetical protein
MSVADRVFPKEGESIRSGDGWAAGALFFVALALRIPFRSHMAYHWDSAEFALAIREYNVALSQPHAPGYFLYVMIGRLVNFFVGDPHSSLVWLSVVSGSGLAALLYLLGTEMFGRRTGLAAALFAITSPQLWFHSCVALTYIVDSFLVCLGVLCCWQARKRNCRWVDTVIVGCVVAIIGGVRPQTVPGLLPLVVYTVWASRNRRLAKLAVVLCVCLIGTMAWLVPMIRMSGGWSAYAAAFHRHQLFNAPSTFAAGGGDALLWNIFFMGLFCWNGLMFGTALLACALLVRLRIEGARKRRWDTAHREALRMLALWIAPMILMGTIVSLTRQPGYVLGFLPAWLILTAVIASELRSPALFGAVTGSLCLVNAVAFLSWPSRWDGIFYHLGRTAREIREHDRQLGEVVSAIRTELDPAGTVICHAREYLPLGLRHLQLYLPEFDQDQLAIDPVMVSPVERPMMIVREGRLGFVHGLEVNGKRVLALVVPQGTFLKDYSTHFELRDARPLPGSGGCVYTIPVEAAR